MNQLLIGFRGIGQDRTPIATGRRSRHNIPGDEQLDGLASETGPSRETLLCKGGLNGRGLIRRRETIVNPQDRWNRLCRKNASGRSQEHEDGEKTGSAEKNTHKPHSYLTDCGGKYVCTLNHHGF